MSPDVPICVSNCAQIHKFKLQSKELEIRSGNCQLPFVFGISLKEIIFSHFITRLLSSGVFAKSCFKDCVMHKISTFHSSTAHIQTCEPVQSKGSESICPFKPSLCLFYGKLELVGDAYTHIAPGTFLWHFAAWRAISSTMQSKMPLIGLEVCSSLGKCLWYTMRTSSIDAAALASLVFTVRQGKLVYFLAGFATWHQSIPLNYCAQLKKLCAL